MKTALRIVTEKPVACDSPDHLMPHGTANDNSTNRAFNRKLTNWLSPVKLRVLDLGCSGGGFVKSILDQGGFAVGVEGSDYSKVRGRAEWATIPDHLFTADITEKFQLFGVDETGREIPLLFDLVTAWEFIEHISTNNLPAVFDNISRHLAKSGVVIMSVSPAEEVIQGVELHLTVQKRDWWLKKFAELGFQQHDRAVAYFRDDWVRGGSNAPGSFHVVLTRGNEDLPSAWRLPFLSAEAALRNVLGRLVAPVEGLQRTARRVLSKLRRVVRGDARSSSKGQR